MKRIIVVSLFSLIIFGVINTLILENTWAGFRYRFVLGSINGIIPFMIGTAIYHVALRMLEKRISGINSFLSQLCLGVLVSLVIMFLFVIMEGKPIIKALIADSTFILGAGIVVSVVYYLVAKFQIKNR